MADFTNNGREDIFSVSQGRIQLLENLRDYVTTSSHLNKPEAPNILKPITGENISADVIFEWSENTPFAQSQIQVASDENFTNMIYELKDYTGLRILIPGLV